MCLFGLHPLIEVTLEQLGWSKGESTVGTAQEEETTGMCLPFN